MSAVCTTKFCISDARSVRTPRAVYINLNNWTDSENEIVKSAVPKVRRRVRVVDGVSCRQMYLRSYKFSRKKESVGEKTKKCLEKVKEKLGQRKRGSLGEDNRNLSLNLNLNLNRKRKKRNGKCLIWKKMKKFSCSFIMFGIFRRILSCAATIDVVEQSRGRN
ncbi:hypothetical protein IC582_009487 [Cucumis melo]|uniref:Uncharacterized protein LOC103486422 n=2 Tax=Cucumis melo TaxID=3656 RepID=A0A1S3B628_CUCME|nr:uncharacterized protein LOC103486422 [Cucumis melo]KAA0044059.1 hypothetical protein E6C27_scaffold236G004070 [Cucumis melo var. makuwa]TYK25078.1 uncharacterized protein E5676_scaffold352G002000 [Cucumis melo var. makuwa]